MIGYRGSVFQIKVLAAKNSEVNGVSDKRVYLTLQLQSFRWDLIQIVTPCQCIMQQLVGGYFTRVL